MRISYWSSDVCSSDLTEVECLVAADDDTYTYNKRINRLAPIQEHRMIQRAIDRGVPRERIADALGLDVQTVRKRTRMLEGICPEAVEILKDMPCPAGTFDILRRMAPMRQMEARSEEHTSELQSLMRISYAVFCLK